MTDKEKVQQQLRTEVDKWKAEHPEWETAESLEEVERRVSTKTFHGYRSILPIFFYWEGKTPQEIMAEREEQLRSKDRKERGYYESRMWEYKKFLMSKHYTPNSVKGRLGKVSGFFTANGLRLNLPKNFWKKASESSALGEASQVTKRPPDNDEIRMILELADPTESLAICLAYQNGMSVIDVATLRWETLNYDFEDKATEFSFYKISRKKTREEAFGVLTPDLIYYATAVWKESGKPTEGWVFKGYKGKRIQTQSITKAYNNLAEKALGKERADQITIKDCRDSFNTALLDSEIETECKDRYMGHKLDSARGAYAYSDATLVRIYWEKVFPKTTINGWKIKKAETDLAKMAERVEETENAIRQLENENMAYKTRVDGLQKRLEETIKSVEQFMRGFKPDSETESLPPLDKSRIEAYQPDEDEEP